MTGEPRGSDRSSETASGRWFPRWRPSEETVARGGAWVLWAVVLLAAAGGVAAWLRPAPPRAVTPTGSSGEPVGEAWRVAGFAERFVARWLAAGPDAAGELAGFLGYRPNLQTGAEAPERQPGPVRAVSVERRARGRWAVTVAAGDLAGSGGERFWRVGVAVRREDGERSGTPVAVGLPSPVAAPRAGARAPRTVRMSAVPANDDPLVEAVDGFVAAHACGRGPLDRWIAPGAAIAPLDPPACGQAELDRWGTAPAGDGQGRRTVVAEVVLDRHDRARRVTYAVVAARRDGRWEIAELLPAPPITSPGAPAGQAESSSQEVGS